MISEQAWFECEPTKLGSLFERAPGFIFITRGPDHRFEFVNKAGMTLAGQRPMIGLPYRDALPEMEAQGYPALLDEAFATGEPFVGEDMPVWYVLPDGQREKRYVQFLLQPIVVDGRVTGIFIEGQDTTQRMEAEERAATLQARLIQVSRVSAMGTMAATMAHELNQPLASSANYLQGLKRLLEAGDPASIEMAKEAADHALAATLRAGNVIRAVRGLMSKSDMAKQKVNPKQLIEDACSLVLSCLCPEGINVTVDAEKEALVDVDPTQIQQVLLNLIRNALEAMEGSPTRRLMIEGRPEKDCYKFCVTDTGAGIEMAEPERLFEPFATTKEDGMGIGLPISRTIVEAHNGRIWWEQNPGGGTRFCFVLPTVQA